MKADLYTARAQTSGTGGLAHRTAAGFVVLTSADGADMIAMIDAQQNESDLIDQIVAAAGSDGPDSFAMLFTAGGELYLLASGNAVASITSPSTNLSMSATAGQVLVHPLSAGINETAANVRLHLGDPSGDARDDNVASGEVIAAAWVEVAIGGGVTPAPSTPKVAAPDAAPILDEEPVAVVSTSTTAPPAAQEIVFAEDIDEIADLIGDADDAPAPEPVVAIIEAEPEPIPASAPEPAPPVEAPTAHEPTPEPDPEPDEVPESTIGPVMVLGVSCQQGHHNHPDAVYCSQCGTKMGVHQTTVLMNGPRPPLGVLVVDDGTTYSLNQDLVLGREPTSHEDIISGAASPMVLTDDTLSLSRKHARIVLQDWTVSVVDLSSSNGTWLSRAGNAEAWTQVTPNTPTALEPGDRLRVGGRIIQVELHHIR